MQECSNQNEQSKGQSFRCQTDPQHLDHLDTCSTLSKNVAGCPLQLKVQEFKKFLRESRLLHEIRSKERGWGQVDVCLAGGRCMDVPKPNLWMDPWILVMPCWMFCLEKGTGTSFSFCETMPWFIRLN